MSLMIKGMKLPISCGSCCFSQTEYKGLNEYCKAMKDEEVTKYMNQNKGRHPQCPLMEIPDNHGRLIDADNLIKVLQDTLDNYSDNYNDGKTVEKLVVETCKQYIDHCPTIIEAEVSE